MTFLHKFEDKSRYISALKLIAVVLVAFLAALFFRRSAGFLAMFPIAFICCGVSAFINIDLKLKLAIFGVTVFALNTVETEDTRVTLIFVALCLLACILFEIAAKQIKGKKKSGYYVAIVSTVVCITLSVFFIGNPIAAIKAQNNFDDYVQSKYLDPEIGAPDEYEFTKVYYNYKTGSYDFTGRCSRFPADAGLISIKGDGVYDRFQPIVQNHLTQPYVSEITTILREKFPSDSFSVTVDDLYAQNQKEIIAADDGELYGKIAFVITLGGVQTSKDMEKKVAQYSKILDIADVDYGKIVFKGGSNPWVVRSATVTRQQPFVSTVLDITRVPTFTSNRFNRFSKMPSNFQLIM